MGSDRTAGYMKAVGRNQPCPCGSGKKYKKCCIDKRPRDQYVYIGYREPFQGVAFENGQVFVAPLSGEKVKADAVLSQTQYTRRSGREKVLSSVPNAATFDVVSHLASQFDVIWAIDTNTREISGSAVSVSSILECRALNAPTARVGIAHGKAGNFIFRNCPDGEAERWAWSKLVAMITSNRAYSDNLRTAIITDHDLTMHSKYNDRTSPIYRDLYLPPNFTLVYASSDAAENVLNALMMKCDSDSRDILRQLETSGAATMGSSTVAIHDIRDLSVG